MEENHTRKEPRNPPQIGYLKGMKNCVINRACALSVQNVLLAQS